MPHASSHRSTFRTWLQRLGITRALVVATLLSILLHGSVVGLMGLASFLELPFMVRFEQSAGIGIMSRIGHRLSQNDLQTAPRYTRVVDLTPPPANAGPAAPTEEERAQMLEAQEAIERKEAEEARRRKEQEAQQAQEDAEARRKRRAERKAQQDAQAKQDAKPNQESERDAASSSSSSSAANQKSAGNQDASDADSDGAPDAGPRLDLPPGDRYPHGTINPVATDLGMWGPEGARLVVVVRNDRIRSSPHAQSVREVLDSFPDWRTLVGGANLDPLQDVDTTLIASANPRYINQTFLAAIHHIPDERVVSMLSQGDHQGVTWREEKGRIYGDFDARSGHDPRQFFIPTHGVFVLSRPEFLRDLEKQAPTPQGLDAARELARLPKEEQTARLAQNDWKQPAAKARTPDRRPPTRNDGWLKGIIEISDYGGTQRNGPAAMISTGKISSMQIKGYRGTMPQSMHANVYADADVRVTGRMIFKKQKEAEALQEAWPDVLNANRGSLNLTGLYRPLADADLKIDHNELTFSFTIPNSTMKRLGVSVSQLMQMR